MKKKKTKLKKFAIFFGIFLLVVVTSFTLWVVWENWTGSRAWRDTREFLISENVELDLKKLNPEIPPEDQNFCAAQPIASIFNFKPAPENDGGVVYENPEIRDRFLKMRLPAKEKSGDRFFPDWRTASTGNFDALLAALEKENPDMESIADWLAQHNSLFAEIRAAADRPEAQIPFQFSDTFVENVNMTMPHMQDVLNFQKYLCARACFALESGDSAAALDSLSIILKLSEASFSQPTLVSNLVGMAGLKLYLSAAWKGFDLQAWNEEELRKIQQQIAKFEIVKSMEKALNVELVAFQIQGIDFIKELDAFSAGQVIKGIGMEEDSGITDATSLLALLPDGTLDHNKSRGARLFFEYGIQPIRERRVPNEEAMIDAIGGLSPRTLLVRVFMPVLSSLLERSFEADVCCSLVQVACAVERYHLENAAYPDSLAELIPKYLAEIPTDLFAPPESELTYEKHNSRYRIYSFGENQKDDAGTVVLKKSDQADRHKGDIVWGYEKIKAP